MGVIRDIVNAADHSAKATDEVRENLEIIMSLAESKGKEFESAIREDLLTGKTIDNLTVAISRILVSKVEHRAVTGNGTDIAAEVGKSLSQIFSGQKEILEGITGLIRTALIAIIGAGEGREAESHSSLVVVEFPAIVRFDFALWGRNIQAKSIKKYMENAFTCVAFKSSIDLGKLTFSDFLALYSPVLRAAFGSDHNKIKEMISQAREIYVMFNKDDVEERKNVEAQFEEFAMHPELLPKRELGFQFATARSMDGAF